MYADDHSGSYNHLLAGCKLQSRGFDNDFFDTSTTYLQYYREGWYRASCAVFDYLLVIGSDKNRLVETARKYSNTTIPNRSRSIVTYCSVEGPEGIQQKILGEQIQLENKFSFFLIFFPVLTFFPFSSSRVFSFPFMHKTGTLPKIHGLIFSYHCTLTLRTKKKENHQDKDQVLSFQVHGEDHVSLRNNEELPSPPVREIPVWNASLSHRNSKIHVKGEEERKENSSPSPALGSPVWRLS